MISPRDKGNNFERKIAARLNELGHATQTARATDRALDAAGVDLVTSAPFDIQCKAVERLRIQPHELLKEMPNRPGKTRVIYHKKKNAGVIVCMLLEDFEKLLL